jgi:hypothetical protein
VKSVVKNHFAMRAASPRREENNSASSARLEPGPAADKGRLGLRTFFGPAPRDFDVVRFSKIA